MRPTAEQYQETIDRQAAAVYEAVRLIDEAGPDEDLEPILRDLVDGFFSERAHRAPGMPRTFQQERDECRSALLAIRRHWWMRQHETPYQRERWARAMEEMIEATTAIIPQDLLDEVARRGQP